MAEVGVWSELKYRLLHTYAEIFASSMKKKWGCRVYIDLFAGAGYAKIEKSDRIVRGSPMLAIDIRDRFDRYVFCEQDNEKLEALRTRVSGQHPGVEARYVPGNVNHNVDRILQEIPAARRSHTVLGFCFADIFSMANLEFTTVERLSSRFVDFLVLIPTGMDAVRNFERYLSEDNETVDRFLGGTQWRADWPSAKARGESIDVFLINMYGRAMEGLKYIYSGISDTKLIRSDERKLPLYRLAFFSRHPVGKDFWGEAKKYSDPQLGFPF